MRLFLPILMLFVWSLNPSPITGRVQQPEQPQSKSRQNPSYSDQRGTEQSPLIVKTLESQKTQAEAEQENEDRQQKTKNDRWIVILTGILALIALGQLGVYFYQANKLRETVESAKEQGKAMGQHVEEAARSADAMEGIATVIQNGNAAVVRAYISVIVGGANYQDRQEGIKFEGKPTLVNTGSTPAKNVRIRISAQIVPSNEADQFPYSISEDIAKASAVAAPHQSYILNAFINDFVPDTEVADIKQGNGKALTVWGIVTYDDIFGESHTTKFAQWLFWYPNNVMYGLYIPGHNDMD